MRDSPGRFDHAGQNTRRTNARRRGIVLVLILAVLGLMAVIGITFATFSGQSRISARNFAQSVNQPQRDELMDYALAQLISDTADIRSAIRGHSLARDMYGNDTYLDANGNPHPLIGGYLTSRPDGAYMPPVPDPYFYVTQVATVPGFPTLFDLTTNITVGDPAFYGYDFTRWTLRVSYTAPGTASLLSLLHGAGQSDPRGPGRQRHDRGQQASARLPGEHQPDRPEANALESDGPQLPRNTSGYNTQLPGYYLVQAATTAPTWSPRLRSSSTAAGSMPSTDRA